jgi:peroxiredoxin
MENKGFTRIILMTASLLILMGFIFLSKDVNPLSLAARDASRKTDRLFSDLGVVPHPYLTVPIDSALKNLNGETIRLSDFRGNIVFLNFWTTWCPDCLIEMPSMQKLHMRLKDKKFVMVAVNLKESAETVKKFFEKYGLTFIALLDSTGDVGTLMGIRAIPTTLIIGKKGKILGMVMGPRKWDSGKSVALFEHLINNNSDDSS